MRRRLAHLLFVSIVLAGCDSGADDTEREVSGTGVVMRPYAPIPPGAVPRGALARADALAGAGPELTEALIARGRERFLTFCMPCHGRSGHGDGPVVQRGFPKPPSYHLDYLRAAPPDYFVKVITQGSGRMWSYADRVPPEDRWAIAGYIKVLQREAAEAGAADAPEGPAQ